LAAAIENTRSKNAKFVPYIKMLPTTAVTRSGGYRQFNCQLTAPVKMDAQQYKQMVADGATLFTEVGPGKGACKAWL